MHRQGQCYTHGESYWQWCPPVAGLRKLLIIDELTCKSIMQTSTEACSKQTHLVWFSSLSFLFYESPMWMSILYVFEWLPLWFMSVQLKSKAINCTFLMLWVILGNWGAHISISRSSQWLERESASFILFYSSGKRHLIYVKQENKGDEQAHLQGTVAKPHTTWQPFFTRSTQQGHSTFNDRHPFNKMALSSIASSRNWYL